VSADAHVRLLCFDMVIVDTARAGLKAGKLERQYEGDAKACHAVMACVHQPAASSGGVARSGFDRQAALAP
jgi:hypothetical protein